MAQRTTPAAVQAVLGANNDWDGVRSVQPFIDSVTGVVDQVVQLSALKPNGPLPASQAEVVERWLAAWAYALSDKPLTQKSTGKASGSFAGQTGMGLEANLYGQFALTADYTGTLRAINKGAVAGAAWLGKSPSEQIPYDRRD